MFEVNTTQFSLFLLAALLLAFTPGPGITYVVARTASGGKPDGLASSFGTAIGGLMHVLAAALGLSIVVSQSAVVFSGLKYLGAAYLVYLGLRMLLSKTAADAAPLVKPGSRRRVFWEGVMVEALNVKTALFFLAFIPQFINPGSPLALQFVILGCIVVSLNTAVDLLAVSGSSYLLKKLDARRTLNQASGVMLVGLGAYLAFFEPQR